MILRLLLAGLLGFALASLLPAAATSAAPSSGTLSPTQTSLTWTGQSYTLGSTLDPAACPPPAADPNNTVCDHFQLTVDADAAYWQANPGGVTVTISWPDPSNDFDLYVFDASGNQVAASAGTSDPEQATIPSASGTYNVTVVPFSVVSSGYSGTAEITHTQTTAVVSGGPSAYHGTLVSGPNPEVAPANTAVRNKGPQLTLRANPVGREAAEPTLGADRTGAAFFAASTFDWPGGELAHTLVMRSANNGATWQVTQPMIVGQDAHPMTLDPYVYVDRDFGRVFDVDTLAAESSIVSFSDDQGATWTTSAAMAAGVNDHQTLVTGVVPAGSPLVTLDPLFPKLVYYCVNTVAVVSCSRSLDGGRTFVQVGSPFTDTGDVCGSLTGHLYADHAGRLFLPAADCGPLEVAISDDAGTTWHTVTVSDQIADAIHDGSIAADASDNLYVTWQDDQHHLPYLSISRDHGETWSTPLMIAPPNVHEVNFPSLDAGDAGRVAISFPGTTSDDRSDSGRPWDYYVVVSTNALDADPLFLANISNPADDPVHRGDCTGRCGGMFDFLDLKVAPTTGGPVWASLSDDCTGACVTDPTAAGDDPDVGQGIAVHEQYGPALTGPNPCLPHTPRCRRGG